MVTREEEPLEPQPKVEKKTFWEKVKYVKDNITVEPILACSVIPSVLSRLAIQNLNLDKACRVNLGYSDEICDALVARKGDKFLKEELKVQELIAGIEAWKNVILTVIPSILILFLGAWSDRTGRRKICILLPIVGDLLSCLSNIVNVYFFYEIPVEINAFFEAFFSAIMGGWIVSFMGVFSYIGDISSKESRTFRIGLINLCSTAGGPIGSALSGILLEAIGYYGVFALTSLLYLFSICYGILYIKDPERPHSQEKDESIPGIWNFLKTFFDTKHVKESIKVTFRKGPNHRRTKLILVFLSIAFLYGPAYGEFTVRYLFTRYRFKWDALKYSFYNTFYICVHSFGCLLSISLFSRYLKWDDSVLGIISSVSKLVGGIATALARNSVEMYLAVVVETFNATSFTALRSISSKLASSDEFGKMISLFNLTEVLTSMIFGPVYSWIYMLTVEVDAGSVYYFSTLLTIPPIVFFGWFFYQHRKLIKENRSLEKAAVPLKEKGEDIELEKSIFIEVVDEKVVIE